MWGLRFLFRDDQQGRQRREAGRRSPPPRSCAPPGALLVKIKAALTATTEEPVPVAEAAAPNRCATCRKKAALLGFACRCGSTFCSLHRYAAKHACEFDFKEADREQIAKNNPLFVMPKINKIG